MDKIEIYRVGEPDKNKIEDVYFLNLDVAEDYYMKKSTFGNILAVEKIDVHTEEEFFEFESIMITISQYNGNYSKTVTMENSNNIDLKTDEQIIYNEDSDDDSHDDFNFYFQVRLMYDYRIDKKEYEKFAENILKQIHEFKERMDEYDDLHEWIDYRWNNKGFYSQL